MRLGKYSSNLQEGVLKLGVIWILGLNNLVEVHKLKELCHIGDIFRRLFNVSAIWLSLSLRLSHLLIVLISY